MGWLRSQPGGRVAEAEVASRAKTKGEDYFFDALTDWTFITLSSDCQPSMQGNLSLRMYDRMQSPAPFQCIVGIVLPCDGTWTPPASVWLDA